LENRSFFFISRYFYTRIQTDIQKETSAFEVLFGNKWENFTDLGHDLNDMIVQGNQDVSLWPQRQSCSTPDGRTFGNAETV